MNKRDEEELAKILVEPLRRKEVDAPKGTKCPKCGSDNVKVIRSAIDHWSGGDIRCHNCGNVISVQSYLVQDMIKVEPINEEEYEEYKRRENEL